MHESASSAPFTSPKRADAALPAPASFVHPEE
jgi:hypothetical protein